MNSVLSIFVGNNSSQKTGVFLALCVFSQRSKLQRISTVRFIYVNTPCNKVNHLEMCSQINRTLGPVVKIF